MDFKRAAAAVLGRSRLKKKPDNSALKKCLEELGNPQLAFRSVHVAGTNGKGSVCAFLAEIFRAAGYKTGLYTSPHLVNINERIRLDGRAVSERDFASAVSAVLRAEEEPLTFFELLTCAAFIHFARKGAEIAVVEAGIGGTGDATNALENPLASVITSVDFDHTELLGETLKTIASEKAGIIKPGVPCVCGPLAKAAAEVIRRRAKAVKAPVHFVGNGEIFKAEGIDWEKGETALRDRSAKKLAISLVGKHQAQNASVAAKCAGVLGVNAVCVRRALEKTRLHARFEIVRRNGTVWIIDGGHNPQAARAFAEAFAASPFGGAVFLLAMLEEKDCAGVIKELSPHIKKAVVTTAPSKRAMSPEKLAECVRRFCPEAAVRVVPELEKAIAAVSKEPAAAVTGSFYLAGAALKKLKIF